MKPAHNPTFLDPAATPQLRSTPISPLTSNLSENPPYPSSRQSHIFNSKLNSHAVVWLAGNASKHFFLDFMMVRAVITGRFVLPFPSFRKEKFRDIDPFAHIPTLRAQTEGGGTVWQHFYVFTLFSLCGIFMHFICLNY